MATAPPHAEHRRSQCRRPAFGACSWAPLATPRCGASSPAWRWPSPTASAARSRRAPGYDVVDAATLTDPRFYSSRSRTSLARAVGAGAVITGLYFPRADSLVVLQLQLFDVQRNRIMRVMESKPIDPRDPMSSVGDLVSATLAALDEVDWKSVAVDSSAVRKPDGVIKP